MADEVIRAEGLGKKFIIDHRQKRRSDTLRDMIVHRTNNLWQRTRQLFHSEEDDQELVHEEFWALRDINFSVQRGERIGVIGRNGAGKSTLLKLLSRISDPTEGRITIRGRVASLLEVGTGFHPELSGRENVYLNGAILGMSRQEIRGKFDEIVAFAGVEKFLDTPVKRYSSGMYVRLAFSVAAHLEPQILIVDEVLAVGDMEFQKKCLGKMEDVSTKEGRTILFVSHNLGAIKSLTSSSIYLKGGRIAHAGPTADVVERYFQDNISAAVAHKDIEFYRRSNREPHANFTAITVNNSHDNFAQVPLFSPIRISICFRVSRPVESTVINLIIRNMDGQDVTCLASFDQGFVRDFGPGDHTVTLVINRNQFAPGKYFATIGLSPVNGALSYDVLVDYPLFEVRNEGKITHWIDRPFGNFIPDEVYWSE